MSRKRQAILLVAVVTGLALLALAIIAIIASDQPAAPAVREARQACDEVEAFERGLKNNDAARDVLKALAEAEKHAKRASELDSAWVPLLGGIQSVQVALNEDDARSAQVGIGVTRTECSKTARRS